MRGKLNMSIKQYETVYIGFSDELIEEILADERYILKDVVTTKGKLADKTKRILSDKSIVLHEIESKGELVNVIETIRCELVLIYKFGMIIPEKYTSERPFFNIHLGDIRLNRGGHSLRWSILDGDKSTKITLYQIDGVDEGIIVDEVEVDISDEDDIVTLANKMDFKLKVLLNSLYLYLQTDFKGGYYTVRNGIYKKKMTPDDYRIDTYLDDYYVVKRKIACMKDFGGAIIDIDGKTYRAYSVVKSDNDGLSKLNEYGITVKKENSICYTIYYKEYIYN